MWGRFSGKKTWIGIEENVTVQKALHVIFKIRLKPLHIVKMVYCKTTNARKDA